MQHLETKIIIEATPQRVWEILMDFQAYGEWNPFIKAISGEKKKGGKLVAVISNAGKKMTFKPVVLVFEEQHELRWLGKLFIKGLFDGEHYFLLMDNGDGTTTFTQGEHFSGMLVGVFASALKQTKAGFIAMNGALKSRAEA
jgi:hypothetical protein